MKNTRRRFFREMISSTVGFTVAGINLQLPNSEHIKQNNSIATINEKKLASNIVTNEYTNSKSSPVSQFANQRENLLDSIIKRAVKDGVHKQCQPWSPKDSLQPDCRLVLNSEKAYLRVESNNSAGCYGGWEIRCTDFNPKKEYKFKATGQISGILFPLEEISIEIFFFSDEDTHPLDWKFVEAKTVNGTNVDFEQNLAIPQGTNQVVIRFILRWSAHGVIQFSNLSFNESKKKPAPKVKMAIGAGWKQRNSIQGNIDKCVEIISKAADQGAEFILLPELILSIGVPGSNWELARRIPGAETDQIAECARLKNIGVGLSVQEANGELVHNTGLIFDDKGEIVLKYRKVHLSVNERWKGVTPGNQYPNVDFPWGRMGMQICYDNTHPEGLRVLASQGVEIVLLPIMGDPRATVYKNDIKNEWSWSREVWDLMMRMRAMDNHIWYIIAQNKGPGSCIIDPSGKIVSSMRPNEEILFAEVDKSFRNPSSIGSDFRNRYWGERRPSTYAPLSNTN